MENFVDIVNEVLNYGFNDGPQVNRARVRSWVDEAQQNIARQVEAPEFQATENLIVQQGVYKYPLPEGFLRMQDIWYPMFSLRLRPVDLQQFDTGASPEAEAPPRVYVTYGKELWVYPIPSNSTDELQVRYIKAPPKLVNDSDVPLLNDTYWQLLVEYAVVKGFEAEDDYEAAQYFAGKYKSDLDDYATDVQERQADRPRVLDGTWSEGNTSRTPWY